MVNKNIKLNQEQSFLSKPHSSNQYDVNLLLAYKQIKEITNDNNIGKSESKEKLLVLTETLIRDFCGFNKLDFDLHLKHNRPIIVEPSHFNFDFYLAFLIIGFDVNRINALLNYQLAKLKNNIKFPSMVESLTYKHVKSYSPFDNSARLKIMMDWVETKRKFVPIDREGNIIEELDDNNYNTIDKNCHFIPKQKKGIKYSIMLKKLIEGKFIQPNTKGSQLKLVFEGIQINKIIWTGSPVEFYCFIQNVIKRCTVKDNKWKIALEHFIVKNKDGKAMTQTTIRSENRRFKKLDSKIQNKLIDISNCLPQK